MRGSRIALATTQAAPIKAKLIALPAHTMCTSL